MTHQHSRARAGAVLAATAGAALVLSACGTSRAAEGAVTVTVTPTVTAGSSPTSTRPDGPEALRSDDVGRAYDFGTVTKVSTVGSTTVLELDRWTWKSLDDATLAKQGVPPGPFKGKPPYTNQNDRITYTIPVADNARILSNHCVAFDQPLQTKSVTVQQLAHLADREDTVLVQLDDRGRLTAAQNIPGCPG